MTLVFLGETVTAPSQTKGRAQSAAATAVMTAMLGGVGALFSTPKHPLAGAVVGAALGGASGVSFAATPFLCGLFETKEKQASIESDLLPRRIGTAIVGGATALLGAAVGSHVSKKHPTIGAVAGASIACGAVAAALDNQECPK
jgi:Na+/phosphate symporter